MIEKKESLNRFQKAEIKRTFQSVLRISKDIAKLKQSIEKVDKTLVKQIEVISKKAEDDKKAIHEKIQKQMERIDDIEAVIIKYYGHSSMYFCHENENGSISFNGDDESSEQAEQVKDASDNESNDESGVNEHDNDVESQQDQAPVEQQSDDDEDDEDDCHHCGTVKSSNQMDYFSNQMNKMLDDF